MTTTVLRPNTYNTSGGVAIVGGGTGHAALADDSDTTYIEGEGTFDVGFTTKTFASGEITKSLSLRARIQNTYISTQLAKYSIYNATVASLDDERGASADEVSGSASSFTGSQYEVDGLVAECAIFQTVASQPRIYEMYVDLVTVAKPVAALAAISNPYTESTMPLFVWANTLDADGGSQTHYHIIVTDDDDGDAVLVDLELVGADTQSAFGPLTNGNYTVSVRVAQTVNGARHWSDYDTASFEVDVDTSDVDTLTATPNNDAGKIAIIAARDGATEDWEFIEVERTIDAGVTWSTVRTATFVDSTGDADSFTVDDYEVANGQTVKYRARATYYSNGLAITGAWIESATVSWSSDDEWLKSPLYPSLNAKIEGVAFSSQGRTASAGRFKVVGRPDRVVVSDALSASSGSITLRVTGQAEALALDELLDGAGVLLLNLSGDSLIGDRRDGFKWVSVISTDETWSTQYYLGNDEDMRLITVSYDTARQPSDATASAP